MAATLATEEQRWAFDLDGYVVYPGLLLSDSDPATVSPVDQLLNPEAITDHPPLLAAIRGLAGHEVPLYHRAAYDGTVGALQSSHTITYELDRAPRWLEPSDEWATDNSIDERHRLGYDCISRPDVVCVWGLRVVCAVGDVSNTSLCVCPASHKSNVLPPPAMQRAEALGATLNVRLQPGDCMIAAATTLVGVTEGRLLELVFADDSRYPQLSSSVTTPEPEWHEELTQHQRNLLSGTRGLAYDGHSLTEEERSQPSLLALNIAPGAPAREEVWFWDLRGYLVLPGVMDSDWLQNANDVLDSDYAQTLRKPVGISPVHLDPQCSPLIAPAPGTLCSEERISGARGTWSLPSPFADPFRRMIDCEPVMKRLAWMIDPGFVNTACYTIVSRDGAAGQPLHGGFAYGRGPNYQFEHGKPRVEQVNIGWALRDVSTAAGDGGLILLPGSVSQTQQ